MNIISWNIKGICNSLKYIEIRALVKNYKANILGLTETKLKDFSWSKIFALCHSKFQFCHIMQMKLIVEV